MAREIMLQSNCLKLYHLLSLIIIKKIIPCINNSLCITLLEDSYSRTFNENTCQVWKILNNFCIDYFANNFPDLIETKKEELVKLDMDLLLKIIAKSFSKCRSN